MTLLEVKQYLDSFINYELKHPQGPLSFQLDRVEKFLGLIGNPHKKIKCLHVAGTKGKGSTCAFIAYMLQSAGYRVGLYTSPHLNDFKERIRILNPQVSNQNEQDVFSGKITDAGINRLIESLAPFIEQVHVDQRLGPLTFFEVLTVMAIYYFYQTQVDFAVLETGLGGRLDATNVVDSLVCGLTPISLDHTQLLGKTVEEIAEEKAAIIKSKKQIVVVAPQPLAAREIINKRCQQIQTKAIFVGEDIRCEFLSQDSKGQRFNIRCIHREYKNLETSLLGRHQMMNTAVALSMLESLQQQGFDMEPEAIQQGIAQTRWPGRFEIISQNPLIILDGAHNPASCRVLTDTVKEIFPNKKIILVLGISDDKDKIGICHQLNTIVHQVILTKSKHPRAYEFKNDELKDLFPAKNSSSIPDVQEAIEFARDKVDPQSLVLVTGSLFVVGEAREILIKRTAY